MDGKENSRGRTDHGRLGERQQGLAKAAVVEMKSVQGTVQPIKTERTAGVVGLPGLTFPVSVWADWVDGGACMNSTAPGLWGFLTPTRRLVRVYRKRVFQRTHDYRKHLAPDQSPSSCPLKL